MSKPGKKGSRDEVRPENKVNAFDDVAALVKERRKYVDWIAALEAKREHTPSGVYAKVHLDYETRLQSVVDKLAAHRDTLADEQKTLRRKLEELTAQIEHHEEQRAETEIRAQVGELSAAALTEALRVADTELERLAAKRSSIEADLGRIEEFFAAAEGKPTTPSRPSQPKAAGGFDELSFLNSVVGSEKKGARNLGTAAVEASGPPLRPVEVPPTPPAEVPAPRPSHPGTPAPAHPSTPQKPEPERPSPPVPTPAPSPEPSPAPEPPAVPTVPVTPPRPSSERSIAAEVVQADGAVEKATEVEPAPKPVHRPSIAMQMVSMTLDADAAPTTAPPRDTLGIIKTGDELPPSILADLRPGSGAEKPLAANVASNNPLSLKSTGPADTKTLKCRECGTMNDPSEWYCERCGAELSSM